MIGKRHSRNGFKDYQRSRGGISSYDGICRLPQADTVNGGSYVSLVLCNQGIYKEKSGNKASTRDVVAEIAKMPLIYEPGTRWSYSLGHDVLAAVVEVVSGMKYSEYLKKKILEPLGIRDMLFDWSGEAGKRICALYMGEFGSDVIKPDDGSMSDSFKVTENYEAMH